MDKKIDQLFAFAAKQNASDVALMAGSQPFIRVQGEFIPVKMPPLGQNAVKHLMSELLTEEKMKIFEEKTNVDFSYKIEGVARFRINCMVQRLGYGIIARIIPLEVPALETLGLPESVVNLLNTPNGMILVTGPSGSGKTTTQASIISKISGMRKDHILTIEEPVEFAIKSGTSLVNQREVGPNTESFKSALKGALREDPDIILIGEMRDTETISLAMTAAETGHLVLGTLNTNNATATISRIVDSFPGDQKPQARLMLSGSLRSIISQQLIKAGEGTGRVLACEVLINNRTVANMIRDNKIFLIKNSMQTGKSSGMITMDESIIALAKGGKIKSQDAVRYAENPNEMAKTLGLKTEAKEEGAAA